MSTDAGAPAPSNTPGSDMANRLQTDYASALYGTPAMGSAIAGGILGGLMHEPDEKKKRSMLMSVLRGAGVGYTAGAGAHLGAKHLYNTGISNVGKGVDALVGQTQPGKEVTGSYNMNKEQYIKQILVKAAYAKMTPQQQDTFVKRAALAQYFDSLPHHTKMAFIANEIVRRLDAGDSRMVKAASRSNLSFYTPSGTEIPLKEVAANCHGGGTAHAGFPKRVKTQTSVSKMNKSAAPDWASAVKPHANGLANAASPRGIDVSKYAPKKPPVTQGNPGARRTAMSKGKPQSMRQNMQRTMQQYKPKPNMLEAVPRSK